MAQIGYTPIQLYSTSTAAATPAAGNLTNSTLGSELAINITDGKLFYKDNLNAVQVIGWKTVPTTAGGTGLTTYTAGDLIYYASGTTLTKLTIGASTTILTSTGSAPQWSATSGITVGTATNLAGGLAGSVPYQTAANTTTMLAIGVSGHWLGSSGTAPQWNAPAALTKTDDTNVTLTLGGSASTALLNAASLTLGWTGTLAVSRGGTGLASFTANGVVYASSTSALATGSAITFDGTNFATTGTATATRFIPSGSTIATNGMYLPASNSIGISTNSIEAIRIDSGQNVGIGVAPSYKFHIKGSGSTSSTLSMYIQNSANTELFFIRDDGAIETGEAAVSPYNNTTGSAANLLVDATGRLYRSTSSIKYKTDVQDATHGLAEVLKLRSITYKGKSEKDKNTIFGGFIAEEVDAIGLTEFVEYAKDGSPDALAYGNMVSLLAKAIQQLNAKIVNLETKLI